MVYPFHLHADIYAFVLFCAGWILIPLYVRHICILIDTELRRNKFRRETDDGSEKEYGANDDRREKRDGGNNDIRETEVVGNHDSIEGRKEQESGDNENVCNQKS